MTNIFLFWCGPFGQALTKLLLEVNPQQGFSVADIRLDIAQDMVKNTFSWKESQFTCLSKNHDDKELRAYLHEADLVIIAVGAKYMLGVMDEYLSEIKSEACLLNVNKGLSPQGKIYYEEFVSMNRPDIKYAALGWGMAANEVIQGETTGATIWCNHQDRSQKLQELFESDTLKVQITSDISWVETTGIVKNILSLHAGFLQGEREISEVEEEIDELVEKYTLDIIDHAQQINVQKETFKNTYCWNHNQYWDIRTSCYGNTRNMRLWRERKKRASLLEAKDMFEKEKINVEWMTTMTVIKADPQHPWRNLLCVKDLLPEIA